MNDTYQPWPYEDPPNTAVFTSVRILDKEDWVHYVTHDSSDGAWQFHPHDGPTPENESAVVSLHHMLSIDPRVGELADLPLGWHAWRESEAASWKRGPTKN